VLNVNADYEEVETAKWLLGSLPGDLVRDWVIGLKVGQGKVVEVRGKG